MQKTCLLFVAPIAEAKTEKPMLLINFAYFYSSVNAFFNIAFKKNKRGYIYVDICTFLIMNNTRTSTI